MRLHHFDFLTLQHCLCCLKKCHFWDRPYLEWIAEAKRPETRKARIAKAIKGLSEKRAQEDIGARKSR